MENPNEKMIRLMRTQAALTACVLLVVLLVGALLTVQFASVRRCVDVIERDLQQIDMDAVNAAVDSFTEAAEQLGGIDPEEVNRALTALQQAAERLGDADVDRINEALTSLKRAAETFGGIDVETFNRVVQALETAAQNLENAGNVISGLFRR